jgi:hypothetical protein
LLLNASHTIGERIAREEDRGGLEGAGSKEIRTPDQPLVHRDFAKGAFLFLFFISDMGLDLFFWICQFVVFSLKVYHFVDFSGASPADRIVQPGRQIRILPEESEEDQTAEARH